MREPKAPALQWYPGDWQRDTALRSCSLAARGLWAEMLWTMHDGEPRGFLRAGARRLDSVEIIARMAGAAPGEDVAALLSELEEAGVLSRDAGGTIYSRRMVRDTKLQDARRAAGAKGGQTTQEKIRELTQIHAERAAEKTMRRTTRTAAPAEAETALAAAKDAGLKAVRAMTALHGDAREEALADIRAAKSGEVVAACVSSAEQLNKRAAVELEFSTPAASGKSAAAGA